MKKHCLASFKTSGSVAAFALELCNFFSDQRSSLCCNGPFLEYSSAFAVTTQGKRHNTFFGQDYKNCGCFKQCRLCGFL